MLTVKKYIGAAFSSPSSLKDSTQWQRQLQQQQQHQTATRFSHRAEEEEDMAQPTVPGRVLEGHVVSSAEGTPVSSLSSASDAKLQSENKLLKAENECLRMQAAGRGGSRGGGGVAGAGWPVCGPVWPVCGAQWCEPVEWPVWPWGVEWL